MKLTIGRIAMKNLMRRRLRSVLTFIGIALSAWVLTSLLGFNKGYENSLNRDIDNLGFQVMLVAKGCPYEAATVMLQGGTELKYMNEGVLDSLGRRPEIERLTPMLMHVIFDPDRGEAGGLISYLGIDYTTYATMKSYLKFVKGEWFSAPEALEVVMGYEAAELEQRQIGDLVLIPEVDVEARVVGILERTGTQDDGTIFLPLHTLQNLFDKPGQLTSVGIKVKPEANIAELESDLQNLQDVQVVSMAQVKQTIMTLISTAKVMVFSIALIAILIAMVGVMNTVLMSVFERFGEIGILKSMGAQSWDIFRLIWIETAILCFTGGLMGNGLTLLTIKLSETLIREVLPYAPGGALIEVDAGLVLISILAVTIVGTISGLYPAWKAARIRPLEAIRAEGD